MKAETKFIRKIQKLSEDEEFQKRHIRNIEKDFEVEESQQEIERIMRENGLLVSVKRETK